MKTIVCNKKTPIGESELVLDKNGNVYHLGISREQLADTVIVVGDPGRVKTVSDMFDTVDVRVSHREFCTHTGTFNGKRISVVSTGIGVDNIDIVVNELDAIVNINTRTRVPYENPKSLDIIRIGTSGTLQEDIPVGSHVLSEYAFGFDGIVWTYQPEFEEDELAIQKAFIAYDNADTKFSQAYFAKADTSLVEKIGKGMFRGITATANGFYGPQNRSLRLALSDPQRIERWRDFSHEGLRITNFEMEASALYSLGGMLGHRTLTVCMILANRYRKEFLQDPDKHMKSLISLTLQRLTT